MARSLPCAWCRRERAARRSATTRTTASTQAMAVATHRSESPVTRGAARPPSTRATANVSGIRAMRLGCPAARLPMRGAGQRVRMHDDPKDRSGAEAAEDAEPREPASDDDAAAAAARREYEEDPSVNPPDERLNDLRGA